MSEPLSTKVQTVGIVGGGRGGTGLLRLFQQSPAMKVVFLADPDYDCPGMQAAREANIRTFTTVEEAFRLAPCEIIFEVSGQDAVLDQLLAITENSGVKVVPHHASRLLVDALNSSSDRLRGGLTTSLTKIKHEITSSLDGSKNLVSRINQIMSSMQMLALNASIEAAKVGVHGKGFMVVADHMTKSVESVRNLTREIETMNTNIMQVSEQIESTLKSLK